MFLPELTAALNSLEKIAWVRLDDDSVRFTVIPDTGSQVWAYVSRPAPISTPDN
jgi:HUS1 checkpoint protein